MVVEVLVDRERRYVDEVAAFPGEFLRLVRPLPLEGVEAVEIQIPVQVVTGALDAEQYFLPHVAELSGRHTGPGEREGRLHAALPGVHLVKNGMPEKAGPRAILRHVLDGCPI